MPVIGTQGSLTYIKGISLGATWQNFYFEIAPTTGVETSIFDSTGNIYASGVNNNNPFTVKINSSNIFATPTVAWSRRITSADAGAGNVSQIAGSSGNVLLEDSSGNIINVITGEYFIYTGQIGDVEINTVLNSSNGNITTPTKYYATNGYTNEYKRPKDGVILANNYIVIGDTNLKSSNAVNNFNTYITSFYTGNGDIDTEVLYTPNGNYTAGTEPTSTINLDNNNNIIFSVNRPSTATIANCNNTLTTINWQKQYNLSRIADCKVDTTTDDTYFVGIKNSTTSWHVGKVDNTGNVLWGVEFGNSAGSQSNPAPEFYNIEINTANTAQVIITGRKTGNISNFFPVKTTIMCLHGANGQINWQRELTFTGTNSYVNSYFETSNVQISNSSLLLSGRLVASNNAGVVMSLPNNGAIPTNGTYTLNGNLTMTYTTSSYTLSNATITGTDVTHTLSGGGGAFGNITLYSNTSIGNTYFSQL